MKYAPAILVGLLTLTSAALAGTPPPPTPELMAKGQQSYQANCTVCHGDQGRGDGPAAVALDPAPRNFWRDTFKKGDCLPQIFDTLTAGIEGSSMPGWSSLSDEERWGLVYAVKAYEVAGHNSKCDPQP